MKLSVTHHEADLNECIDWCVDCQRVCSGTITHCLEKGGAHAEPNHIQRLLDCAEICRTAASFMMHDSSFASRLCGACAEVCIVCADGCERLGIDEVMQHCAGVCRACADSCHRMIRAAA